MRRYNIYSPLVVMNVVMVVVIVEVLIAVLVAVVTVLIVTELFLVPVSQY